MEFEIEVEGVVTKDVIEMAFLNAWPSSVLLSEDHDATGDWAIIIRSQTASCDALEPVAG